MHSKPTSIHIMELCFDMREHVFVFFKFFDNENYKSDYNRNYNPTITILLNYKFIESIKYKINRFLKIM